MTDDSRSVPSKNETKRFRPITNGTAFMGMAQVGNPKGWGGQQVDYVLASDHEAEVERLRAVLQKLDNGYKYPTEVCQIAREGLSGDSSAPEPRKVPRLPPRKFDLDDDSSDETKPDFRGLLEEMWKFCGRPREQEFIDAGVSVAKGMDLYYRVSAALGDPVCAKCQRRFSQHKTVISHDFTHRCAPETSARHLTQAERDALNRAAERSATVVDQGYEETSPEPPVHEYSCVECFTGPGTRHRPGCRQIEIDRHRSAPKASETHVCPLCGGNEIRMEVTADTPLTPLGRSKVKDGILWTCVNTACPGVNGGTEP